MGQLELTLPVDLQPKARPRYMAKGKPYTDAAYRHWMKNTRAILAEWWTRPPLKKGELIRLHITFVGPGRSDLDNLAGAVLDAGLPDPKTAPEPRWGGCWVDDRVTVISCLELHWLKRPAKEQSIYLSVTWK